MPRTEYECSGCGNRTAKWLGKCPSCGEFGTLNEAAAQQRAPHMLVHYLRELATEFHAYYNAHQFLVADAALRDARLVLIRGVRQVICNGLALLGVSAPEAM